MNIMTPNFQAAIFPHASISEENLKKMLSLFEKVILFQPWHMEKAPSFAGDSLHRLQVLNPPERLKPGEHFRSLLAEYRQWVQGNQGTGLSAFLAVARERFQNPAVYEIRGMIRTMGKPVAEGQTSEALQCHLILHLAEELEEEQRSAHALLHAASRLDSPLKGAIEGEDAPGLLDSVTGFERESFFTEDRLAQIFDAWFCLYGEKVPDRVPLITTEPQMMQFLKETWEEFVLESPEPGLPGFSFYLPDRPIPDVDEGAERRRGLKQATAEFCKNPEGGFLYPAGPGEAPGEAAGGTAWSFLHLPTIPKDKLPGKRRFMKGLSGRIIGLVRDGAPDGR